MSVDSELHERAQKVARRKESDLYWDSDRYIDRKTGRVLARVVANSPIQVFMNGRVVAEFQFAEQAKHWVEEQNL